jgi:hypothetical protein
MNSNDERIIDLLKDNARTGKVSLIGIEDDNISSYLINNYLNRFCNNYLKVEIIKRVCILKQVGFEDSQFILAEKSADLFINERKFISRRKPTEALINCVLKNENFDRYYHRYPTYHLGDYIILASKSNPRLFWNGIYKRSRPVVFLETRGNLIPLIGIFDEEAIKVTALSYNSPLKIEMTGLGGTLVDLFYARSRNQRDEEIFINNQIGQSADNIYGITRASQIVQDERTPAGVRQYAQNTLEQLLDNQAKMNERLGIRIQKLDKTI